VHIACLPRLRQEVRVQPMGDLLVDDQVIYPSRRALRFIGLIAIPRFRKDPAASRGRARRGFVSTRECGRALLGGGMKFKYLPNNHPSLKPAGALLSSIMTRAGTIASCFSRRIRRTPLDLIRSTSGLRRLRSAASGLDLTHADSARSAARPATPPPDQRRALAHHTGKRVNPEAPGLAWHHYCVAA